jgi:hypothetical protein
MPTGPRKLRFDQAGYMFHVPVIVCFIQSKNVSNKEKREKKEFSFLSKEKV